MRAILLDRDDTINEDPGYLADATQVRLLPRVVEGLSLLRSHGYRFFVMSNQSGVARGLISGPELQAVNDRISELLLAQGIVIERFYVCPHRDEDGCDCRKPKPGLFRQFFQDWNASGSQCFAIGDKPRDLEAARPFGVRGILLQAGKEAPVYFPKNLVYRAVDLLDAADYIIRTEGD
ncbi:MAG TPA: HAD family hydrolase [Leptospiraceae bacterium]|jgi:D-glycero-D-manno-heptose 1,7-bisphosphate phosphatase|nr:HAD family hydrolase [Leptospirales bacterium]HMU83337.1 HAD family hydrolase [Leptospiraceae bacterium]HMX57269.1 HAD family hydrolase [Leptospiraceae bacterium]HMY46827.1 HAD family hydrolase [Leptospiraceae bacterium]HMZ37988.1 HAD family hydrolase [Leptospiraceae bacterium]